MDDEFSISRPSVRLANKVAVVTGASGGIGSAAARRFADEGASLVLVDVGDSNDLLAQLRRRDVRVECFRLDLTCDEAVRQFAGEVAETFGAVDVLYNNAGGSGARDGTVTTCEADEFMAAINRNLTSTWLCSRHFIPIMQRGGGGSIINTTSGAAQRGTPGKSAYTAAKGAIAALTRAMAVDYAKDRIRVNAISPGGVATDRIRRLMDQSEDTRRLVMETSLLGPIEPVDIAEMAVYLASEESRVTTGQVFQIDSGYTV